MSGSRKRHWTRSLCTATWAASDCRDGRVSCVLLARWLCWPRAVRSAGILGAGAWWPVPKNKAQTGRLPSTGGTCLEASS
eukprot:15446153-Alexandrium_andersonii.AAC.1